MSKIIILTIILLLIIHKIFADEEKDMEHFKHNVEGMSTLLNYLIALILSRILSDVGINFICITLSCTLSKTESAWLPETCILVGMQNIHLAICSKNGQHKKPKHKWNKKLYFSFWVKHVVLIPQFCV